MIGPGEALPGALGGSYQHVGAIRVGNYPNLGAGDSELALLYKYYLSAPVLDDDKPYRLQTFFQHSSYIGGTIVADGIGSSSLFLAEGQYFFEEMRLAVGGKGGGGASIDKHAQGILGGEVTYYFTDAYDLALELEFSGATAEQEQAGGPKPRPIIDVVTRTFAVGARYVTTLRNLAMLEIAGGYRQVKTEEKGAPSIVRDGIIVDARYYFNKQIFAGVGLTMEPDRFSISGGYTAMKNFYVEIELGEDTDPAVGGQFLRIEAGMRF